MARRSDTYVVKITHSCDPDPQALERRRQARLREAQARAQEG